MKKAVVRAAGMGVLAIAATFLGAGVSSAETVPDGVYQGTVNGAPVPIWEGKNIYDNGTGVINRLSGTPAFPGNVYAGPSRYDGKPVVHIDYRRLSPQLGAIFHDEVVQDVANPNRLNGTMYFTGFGAPLPVLSFTLTK